ncbi:MAG: IS66-like element accessory protein TnpA [Hyphomicrobium sp.]
MSSVGSGDCSVGMSGDSGGRYDVVVGRRVFSREQKRAIVAEASGHGVNVSAVARRHGIKPSLLFRWRRDFAASAPQPPAGRFLAVSIETPSATKATPPAKAATIEIELAFGRKLRVSSDIDAGELRRIIAALETA